LDKTERLAFAGIMAALANILSAGSIPLALPNFSTSIHFTQLPIFVAGGMAGMIAGLIAGAVGGLLSSFLLFQGFLLSLVDLPSWAAPPGSSRKGSGLCSPGF
jgi:thiamine transporter ThiT